MYKVGRSRTPQGVRGLKQIARRWIGLRAGSHSARSAWIETLTSVDVILLAIVALRKECVD